jgi:hypothetical protein
MWQQTMIVTNRLYHYAQLDFLPCRRELLVYKNDHGSGTKNTHRHLTSLVSSNQQTGEAMQTPPSGGFFVPGRKVVWDLISEREAEIESLRLKLKEMDQTADEDICEHWEREARQLRPLLDKIDKIKKDTENLITTRTATLLEDQDPVNEKIRSLRRANELSKASIAAIGQTPSEILSLIFREYIEMDCSVWDLVPVSQHWRRVALATPHLWNALTITSCRIYYDREFKDNGKTYLSHGRRHICKDLARFRDILDRCGTVSLDVCLTSSFYKEEDSAIEKVVACLKLLNSSSIIKRVMSLELNGSSTKLVTTWPDCFKAVSLTNLQHLKLSLRLSDEWRNNLFSSISNSTNRLQTFRTTIPFDSSAFSDRIWLGIRCLEFQPNFPIDQLNSWVEKITHLEKLLDLPCPWPSVTTPRSTFTNLIEVALKCTPRTIRRLYLPALQSLQISDSGLLEPSGSTLESANYPSLTLMIIDSHRPDRWLTNISASRLESLNLTVRSRYNHNINFENVLTDRFTLLTNISLAADIKDDVAITMLECLPSVTSATLVTLQRDYEYGLALLPRLTEYDERFSCSPNLKELTMGSLQGQLHTRKGPLVPLINRLTTARKKKGSPLHKIEVMWRGTEQYQQYI